MPSIISLVKDSLHLCFPHHCCGCNADVISKHEMLCAECLHNLPYTRYEQILENPVKHIFTGRMPLQLATSLLYFTKGNIVQKILHELKYKRNAAIGRYTGGLLGIKMRESGNYNTVDALIPLPLYPKKEYKRGYNQAEVICQGISKETGIPVITKNVVRQRPTETQTKKHRTERWENVAGSFTCINPESLKHKHILLVDDVLTTGATIEACASAIASIDGIKISLATIAIADK